MSNKVKEVVYGIGGHDESMPNNNIIEVIYYSDEEMAEIDLAEKKAEQKATLLAKLGITEDEAKLLLG